MSDISLTPAIDRAGGRADLTTVRTIFVCPFAEEAWIDLRTGSDAMILKRAILGVYFNYQLKSLVFKSYVIYFITNDIFSTTIPVYILR